MNKSKVHFFRNKERNKGEESLNETYIPQYKSLGIQPNEYKSSVVPANTPKVTPSPVNPREKRSLVRQPYASINTAKIGAGSNVLPNVGNNVEQSWSSLDGEVIDDLQLDPSHQMIDNNDFVNTDSLNFTPSQEFEHSNSEELLDIINELQQGSYLLFVKNVPICSGPKEEIEDQVQALVFGTHELCDGESIDEENVVVLKKVQIKVGASIE